jgi:hypothetical protein
MPVLIETGGWLFCTLDQIKGAAFVKDSLMIAPQECRNVKETGASNVCNF